MLLSVNERHWLTWSMENPHTRTHFQLKQYKLEQREITHLVNVANILRENPQRKPKYVSIVSLQCDTFSAVKKTNTYRFDYEGVFAEAEKGEEAGERTQFNTGIYVSKYHMLPTDQRVQRETKIYQ